MGFVEAAAVESSQMIAFLADVLGKCRWKSFLLFKH